MGSAHTNRAPAKVQHLVHLQGTAEAHIRPSSTCNCKQPFWRSEAHGLKLTSGCGGFRW